jgi:hypothetical protein
MDCRASAVNRSLPPCGTLGLPYGQSITTGFVGMTFGCLAFRLGVREGHLTAERRLPLGYSAQEGGERSELAPLLRRFSTRTASPLS